MSDNEERLYEPRVRPREREDAEADIRDSETPVVLRISPGDRNSLGSLGVVITLPTIHEVPLVPGPELVQ